MSRMRTVKPEFFRSATIGRVSRDARLLFIGMWTEADDEGRGLAEARHLAGTLFPFDRGVTDRKINAWLRELADVVCSDGERGLIVLYEAQGTRYYAIRNWWHQKINRPKPGRYPPPPPRTLFDTDSGTSSDTPESLNTTPQDEESESLTRQGQDTESNPSGVRGQGSESESEPTGFRTGNQLRGDREPPPRDPDGNHEDPGDPDPDLEPDPELVEVLERNGQTEGAIRELRRHFTRDELMAKYANAEAG